MCQRQKAPRKLGNGVPHCLPCYVLDTASTDRFVICISRLFFTNTFCDFVKFIYNPIYIYAVSRHSRVDQRKPGNLLARQCVPIKTLPFSTFRRIISLPELGYENNKYFLFLSGHRIHNPRVYSCITVPIFV